MNLKFDLNRKQREAVTHNQGPALVIAGAGSGKTRVITYRTANLIKNGVDPSRILTVTFTNKAASEMKERVNTLLDNENLDNMWSGTFHAMCLRILTKNLSKIGYNPNFLIYDQEDSEKIVKDITNDWNLSKEIYEPSTVRSMIDNAKMDLIKPENYMDSLDDDSQDSDFYQTIQRIYQSYQDRLKNNNAFDFTDLIVKTIELFRKDKYVLNNYQQKFKYIQCDEYQDTNHSQYLILNMLAKPQNNLFVVGDSDQSIYGFRGANIENILNFDRDYPNAEVIRLERNYRSTGNIIEASNELIDNNINRKEKESYTENPKGSSIVKCEADTSYEEANFVTQIIRSMNRNNKYDYKDMTILYRSNYQSRAFESKFIESNIPYTIVNGIQFFDRKEIKDFMSFLRIGINLNDTTSLKRIIDIESNGIGPVTVSKLQNHAVANNIPLIDVIESPTQVKGIGKVKGEAIDKFKENRIQPVRNIIKDNTLDLQEKIFNIYKEINYDAILKQDEDTYERRSNNIEEFFNYVNDYCNRKDSDSLSDFLINIKLVNDQDEMDEEENTVKLMTVHSAKGLEFPVVFLVGMEEETFPHYHAVSTGREEDIEEERRLCYVAMTRAEERLFISHCNARFQFYEFVQKEPSRFLEEIPQNYVKKVKVNNNQSQNKVS